MKNRSFNGAGYICVINEYGKPINRVDSVKIARPSMQDCKTLAGKLKNTYKNHFQDEYDVLSCINELSSHASITKIETVLVEMKNIFKHIEK